MHRHRLLCHYSLSRKRCLPARPGLQLIGEPIRCCWRLGIGRFGRIGLVLQPPDPDRGKTGSLQINGIYKHSEACDDDPWEGSHFGFNLWRPRVVTTTISDHAARPGYSLGHPGKLGQSNQPTGSGKAGKLKACVVRLWVAVQATVRS